MTPGGGAKGSRGVEDYLSTPFRAKENGRGKISNEKEMGLDLVTPSRTKETGSNGKEKLEKTRKSTTAAAEDKAIESGKKTKKKKKSEQDF